MKSLISILIVLLIAGLIRSLYRRLAGPIFPIKNRPARLDLDFDKEEPSDVVMRVASHLSSRLDESNWDNLNVVESTILLVDDFQAEINNGGFDQFFLNSSGDMSTETVEALERIGAVKTAQMLRKAIEQFPKSLDFHDSIARHKALMGLDSHSEKIFQELDGKFYEYEESVDELLFRFIKQNTKAIR